MKKILCISMILSMALLAGCQKENAVQEEGDSKGNTQISGNKVTISASIPKEGLTKVAFQEVDNGGGKMRLTKLSWEYTDVLTVNGNEFTVQSGSISADGSTATFVGTDPGDGPYNIVLSSKMPASIAQQTQPADGDAGNLGYSISITGANDYKNVQFSSEWASSHGSATLAVSSVLQLRALLPDAVASAVKKVIFKSSNNDAFGTGVNTITVTLTTAGTAGDDKTLDVYVALPAGLNVTLSDDMDLLVQFQCDEDKEYDKYTAYRQIANGTNFIRAGYTQYLGLDCSQIDSFANKSTANIGGSTNPYLIGDQHQMAAIALSTEKKYYILVDDIDMTGVTWSPLNPTSPFNQLIDLDGNHKTISKLSGGGLFYVFKGSAKDLTLDQFTVNNGAQRGAFAQFIQGTGNVITNVDVSNSTIQAGNQAMGGLIGKINSGSTGTPTATITNCDVTNTSVTGKASYGTGGLIGLVDSSADVTISNCTVSKVGEGSASVNNNTNNTHNVGGLIGAVSSNSTISNCAVTSVTVSGKGTVGGFVGSISNGTFTNCTTTGTATGTSNVGGFAGQISGGSLSGTRTNKNAESTCIAKGDVTGSGDNVGGFVGNATGGSFTCCDATGKVSSGGKYVGGFVGLSTGNLNCQHCRYWGTEVKTTSNEDAVCLGGFCGAITGSFTGTIRKCWVSQGSSGLAVNSTNKKARVGGFIGQIGAASDEGNTGTFTQCRAHKVTVTGGMDTGGFVGVSYVNISQSCTTGGSVTSNNTFVGGFAGYQQYKTIDYCYSTNNVTGGSGNNNYVGGMFGYAESVTVSYCYVGGVTLSGKERGSFIGSAKNGSQDHSISWIKIKWIGSNNGSSTDSTCHRYADSDDTNSRTIYYWANEYGWGSTGIWTIQTGENPTMAETETIM